MSRKTIPESTVIHCDICGNGVGKEENTITLAGNSIAGGSAVGPAYMSGIYDCYNKFNALIRKIKNENIK